MSGGLSLAPRVSHPNSLCRTARDGKKVRHYKFQSVSSHVPPRAQRHPSNLEGRQTQEPMDLGIITHLTLSFSKRSEGSNLGSTQLSKRGSILSEVCGLRVHRLGVWDRSPCHLALNTTGHNWQEGPLGIIRAFITILAFTRL